MVEKAIDEVQAVPSGAPGDPTQTKGGGAVCARSWRFEVPKVPRAVGPRLLCEGEAAQP